jgi:hypothetical protein
MTTSHASAGKSPSFESGVVKIMQGQTEDMTREEQMACKCLQREYWKHLYPEEDDEFASGDS